MSREVDWSEWQCDKQLTFSLTRPKRTIEVRPRVLYGKLSGTVFKTFFFNGHFIEIPCTVQNTNSYLFVTLKPTKDLKTACQCCWVCRQTL